MERPPGSARLRHQAPERNLGDSESFSGWNKLFHPKSNRAQGPPAEPEAVRRRHCRSHRPVEAGHQPPRLSRRSPGWWPAGGDRHLAWQQAGAGAPTAR